MPTVPRYQQSVRLEPLPGVRGTAALTPDAAGVGVARAKGALEATKAAGDADTLGLAADTIGRIGTQSAYLYGQLIEKARDEADRTAVLAATNKVSAWKEPYLFDPKSGAFTRQGEAALGLPEEALGEFDRVTGEVAGALSNDRQRQAYEQWRAGERESFALGIYRHTFQAAAEYKDQTEKAAIDHSLTDTMRAYLDPPAFGANLDRVKGLITARNQRLGLDPIRTEQDILAATTAAHAGAINQLLAREQPMAAKAWLETAKKAGEIDPEKVDDLQTSVEGASQRKAAQVAAAAIIAKGGTLDEQRKAAKTIEDADVQDMALAYIEHDFSVRQTQQRLAEEDLERQAYAIVDKAAGHSTAAIPANLWGQLSGPTKASLIAYGDRLARGRQVQSDLGTYYSLLQQAAKQPDDFAEVNLMKFRGQLDDQDFHTLAGLQLSIRNKDRTQSEKDLSEFRSRTQLLDDALAQHGIDPKAADKDPTGPVGRSVAQLRRMVDLRVDLLQQTTGRKASNQDIQSEIDRILSATVTGGTRWWDPMGNLPAIGGKRVIDLTIDDVPTLDRQQIEAALRARNRPVSDVSILDTYIEYLLRKK